MGLNSKGTYRTFFTIQAFISQTGEEIPFRNSLLFAKGNLECITPGHRVKAFFYWLSLWPYKLLKVGRKTLNWKSWTEAGIFLIKEVFDDDFEQMMAEYKIPPKKLLKISSIEKLYNVNTKEIRCYISDSGTGNIKGRQIG